LQSTLTLTPCEASVAGGAGPADAFGHIWARRKDPRLVHADLGLNQGRTDRHSRRRLQRRVSGFPCRVTSKSVSGPQVAKVGNSRGGGERKWRRTAPRSLQLHPCLYGPHPLKENPLFPLQLIGGGAVAELEIRWFTSGSFPAAGGCDCTKRSVGAGVPLTE